MATALFISEARVKECTVINGNVDMKVLNPIIAMAQEMYMLPALGTALYRDIEAQIVSSSVSSAYQTLLDDYIQPCLMWFVLYESRLPLSYKVQNKNIAEKNSDNSNQVSMSTLQMLRDNDLDKAQWYGERLTRFLIANPTVYPKFNNQGNADASTIYPNKTNYYTGMYLEPGIDCDRVPAHIKYQGNNPFIYCK